MTTTRLKLTDFPYVAEQLDRELHPELDLSTAAAGSHELLGWRCPLGPDHRWKASPANRTRHGSGCPFCAGKRASITNNLNLHPEVAAQLDPELNNGLTPSQVPAGSRKNLWWRCPAGPDHVWETTPGHRTGRGTGCPCCVGLKVSVTNDLNLHPKVAAQLDPELNNGRTPDQIVAGSGKRFWWRCPEGPDHVWRTTAVKRTREGYGCPACSGDQVSVTNDLNTRPEIAVELDPELNDGLSPDQLSAGSDQLVRWRCAADPEHTWAARVYSRTGKQSTGCPHCTLYGRSAVEIRLAHELAEFLPVVVGDNRVETTGRRLSVDILVRGELLAIEFDGWYWHRGRESKDAAKSEKLNGLGWTVIRVRADLPLTGENDVLVPRVPKVHAMALAVLRRIHQLRPTLLDPAALERYAALGKPVASATASAYLSRLGSRENS